jgi:hypothetical protein
MVRKTGDLRSVRKEYRKSRSIAAIDGYTVGRGKSYEITAGGVSENSPRRRGGAEKDAENYSLNGFFSALSLRLRVFAVTAWTLTAQEKNDEMKAPPKAQAKSAILHPEMTVESWK